MEKAVPSIGWNFVRSQFASPATARTVLTLAAQAGLQKSLSGYKQLDVILPPADATVLDLTTLLTVKRLYTTAQGLELPEGALASALMPKNAADLTNQYLQSLLKELSSGFPTATDVVTLKGLLDLQKSFATLGQASTALRTYDDNLNLAINLAQTNDHTIEAWAKQANSTGCVAAKSASNQAVLAASQSTVPASAQMSFSVRHRHSTFLNLQTSQAQSSCSGTLSVSPDGTVKYDCDQTQDPSGRCDHLSFSPGSLTQVKIGLDGSLHLASKTQGKFDFYGDRNSIKQAQAAISPLIQK